MMLLTPQATLWARKLCRALTSTQTASGEPCGVLGRTQMLCFLAPQ